MWSRNASSPAYEKLADPDFPEPDSHLSCQHVIAKSNARLIYLPLFISVILNIVLGVGWAGGWQLSSRCGKPLLRSQRMLPIFPHGLVTFNSDAAFADTNPDDPGTAWESIMPNGKGFIDIPDPKAWGLEGGYPLVNATSPQSEQYVLSVFHQLHCVATLKAAFARLRSGDNRTASHDNNADMTEDHMIKRDHTSHCLDYLRQSIMCYGDTTLEKAFIEDGKPSDSVDGWGVTHECRDWDAFFSYAEIHRSMDRQGLLNVEEVVQ